MATARRPFGLSDGSKKDDDHKSKGSPGLASLLRSLKTVRRRRIFLGLLAIGLIYLFIKNIPTDVPPVSERYDNFGAQRPSWQRRPPGSDRVQPPTSDEPSKGTGQDYDGPIKFYNLAASLRGQDFHHTSQANVLFAFSNVRSASHVVSAACAMAHQSPNKVHVALMGRQVVDVKELLTVNNLPENECPVVWHDAQPDHALDSSKERMRASVDAALGHLHKTLTLHAILFDDSHREDEDFVTAVKAKSYQNGLPAIRVPQRDAWMLSLDASSLRVWNVVSIDIVVRAPTESSGSLIRLLKSIKQADYGGLSPPKLTIELPAQTAQALLDYIASYQWPPHATFQQRMLTVRRRADPNVMGSFAASLSTLESFYSTTTDSHILVLSPEVELSSTYYQLTMYLLLQYKYANRLSNLSPRLFGISLESLPEPDSNNESVVSLRQSFGWSAMLCAGDKWNELHDFVSLRTAADPGWKKTIEKDSKVSPTVPVWQKAALEMMQAQGYFILYPRVPTGSSPLITIHRELAQVAADTLPVDTEEDTSSKVETALDEQGDVLTVKDIPTLKDQETPMLSTTSIQSMLAENRTLTTESIPLFDITGKKLGWNDIAEQAAAYSEAFASRIGGCTAKVYRSGEPGSLEHLFCT